MSLYEGLVNDMKNAMKSQDKELLSTIRMFKSAIDLAKINNKLDRSDVPDELVIEIASRQVKNYKENIIEFDKAGRSDLSDKLKKEIDIISKYLPEQMSEEEVKKEVESIFELVKPTSKQDKGKLMKEASTRLKGKADFKLISELVDSRLNSL